MCVTATEPAACFGLQQRALSARGRALGPTSPTAWGSATIEKEARWLPHIGPLLPVPVPQVVALGEPDLGYPERWSVVYWLDGDVPTVVDPVSDAAPTRRALAPDLASVVNALRDIEVPHSALSDPELRWYRGAPLRTRDVPTRRAVEACRAISDLDLDLDAALRVWEETMALPEVGQPQNPAVVPRGPVRREPTRSRTNTGCCPTGRSLTRRS